MTTHARRGGLGFGAPGFARRSPSQFRLVATVVASCLLVFRVSSVGVSGEASANSVSQVALATLRNNSDDAFIEAAAEAIGGDVEFVDEERTDDTLNSTEAEEDDSGEQEDGVADEDDGEDDNDEDADDDEIDERDDEHDDEFDDEQDDDEDDEEDHGEDFDEDDYDDYVENEGSYYEYAGQNQGDDEHDEVDENQNHEQDEDDDEEFDDGFDEDNADDYEEQTWHSPKVSQRKRDERVQKKDKREHRREPRVKKTDNMEPKSKRDQNEAANEGDVDLAEVARRMTFDDENGELDEELNVNAASFGADPEAKWANLNQARLLMHQFGVPEHYAYIMDRNNDKKISYAEFYQLVTDKFDPHEDAALRALDTHDSDGNAFLEEHEADDAIESGEHFPTTTDWRSFDTDDDGGLSFDEITEMVKTIRESDAEDEEPDYDGGISEDPGVTLQSPV